MQPCDHRGAAARRAPRDSGGRPASMLGVDRAGPEQRPAHRLAQDIGALALALAGFLLLEDVLHLRDREERALLDAAELPPVLDLVRGPRVGGLAVGLGAAPERQEVIIE